MYGHQLNIPEDGCFRKGLFEIGVVFVIYDIIQVIQLQLLVVLESFDELLVDLGDVALD